MIEATCTLVNRVPWPLKVFFDGQDIPIAVGETPGFPVKLVIYAKRQNPVRGTEDPYGDPLLTASLVGVKGTKDDCTPLDPDDIRSRAHLEVIDRSQLIGVPEATIIRGRPISAWEARIGREGAGVSMDVVNER